MTPYSSLTSTGMLKYDKGVSELSAVWTILNFALVGLRAGIGSSVAALSHRVSNDPQPTDPYAPHVESSEMRSSRLCSLSRNEQKKGRAAHCGVTCE